MQLKESMKTATVSELRYCFGRIAKWIEWGEAVTITRNGKAFATLTPPKPPKWRKVDWAAHLAKYPPVGRRLSAKETEQLWCRLRD
jgi:antitoxin (DNA-binding transcriptional repressor) of toxin-antitoxin stability system